MIVDTSFALDVYSRAIANNNLVNRLSRAVGTCPDAMRYKLHHDESTIPPIVGALDVICEEGFDNPTAVAVLMFSAGCAFEAQQQTAANNRALEAWEKA